MVALQNSSNRTPTVEITAGTTHSLTTLANQRVIVYAKFDSQSQVTHSLDYNGVVKDSKTYDIGDGRGGCLLQYTETPGAATANITLTTSGTLRNPVIMVLKF